MGSDTNSWCSLGFAEPSAAYTSATRQARHLTEGWMAGHGVRPACPADRLPPLPNNTRVGDFRCAACGEEYELKSGQGAVGRSNRPLLPLREKVGGAAARMRGETPLRPASH